MMYKNLILEIEYEMLILFSKNYSFSFSGISYQNHDGIVQVTTMLLSHILKHEFNVETFELV